MSPNDFEPLDPTYVQDVLSRPPFVTISGVPNIRDLGSYPSTIYPGKSTRPGFIFRSAEVSGITNEGVEQMRDLGIAKIFDLRSDTEMKRYNSPVPVIDGVEVRWTPVFKTEDYSPEMMAKRFQLYASGKIEAFMQLYSQILDHAGPSFGAILRHIRDKPSEGCLFHCTAGKDRTGLIAAIILKLGGVDNEVIAEEYALTRIGREPSRLMIMERLAKEPYFQSNNEAAMNMLSCRHETMVAFLKLFEEKYGGAEEYCKKHMGLTDDDLTAIRNNILTPTPRL
ncbi:protein-tyrosine phosphatase-like protein [Infundibulicybe gibba]|nr:protein-tyrosine phosphatase-like protein [Infundibulicybe gibba]